MVHSKISKQPHIEVLTVTTESTRHICGCGRCGNGEPIADQEIVSVREH